MACLGKFCVMNRYLLRFRGDGFKPPPDVDLLRSCEGVKVIDDTSNRMVLVECLPETIAMLSSQLTDWLIEEESFSPLPDTRVKLE